MCLMKREGLPANNHLLMVDPMESHLKISVYAFMLIIIKPTITYGPGRFICLIKKT